MWYLNPTLLQAKVVIDCVYNLLEISRLEIVNKRPTCYYPHHTTDVGRRSSRINPVVDYEQDDSDEDVDYASASDKASRVATDAEVNKENEENEAILVLKKCSLCSYVTKWPQKMTQHKLSKHPNLACEFKEAFSVKEEPKGLSRIILALFKT